MGIFHTFSPFSYHNLLPLVPLSQWETDRGMERSENIETEFRCPGVMNSHFLLKILEETVCKKADKHKAVASKHSQRSRDQKKSN